jgi:hypothetical protein
MVSSVVGELDFIEELRLRRWAREHYVPPSQRETSWHPVVHDEMKRRDNEKGASRIPAPVYAQPKR